MAYDEKYIAVDIPHNLVMEGRKKLSISGITDVESFNEEEIVMASSKWVMTVRGESLHMEKLSVDTGDVVITGRIDLIEYDDGAVTTGGFFSRIFK